jgi:hypothetical protein
MADESAERRAPSPGRSGQPAADGGPAEIDRASNRRRNMIASLLAAPAVMTLGARSARAQASVNCLNSLKANPNPSHPCH